MTYETHAPRFEMITFGPDVEVLTAVKNGDTEIALYVGGINDYNLTTALYGGEGEEPVFSDACFDTAAEAYRELARFILCEHGIE